MPIQLCLVAFWARGMTQRASPRAAPLQSVQHCIHVRQVMRYITPCWQSINGCVLRFQLNEAFSVGQLLGTWEGKAKVLRSDLYGGTKEEQPTKTVYSAEGTSVIVVSETACGALLDPSGSDGRSASRSCW